METSDTITNISAALVQAQHEMGNAVKDSKNPFYKSTYADINSVREACIPILNKHGICALQPTVYIDGKSFVKTVLLHESGEYISSVTEIISNKPNDAQSHGSGISYARRYALQSIINIGCEDDDANTATGNNIKANHVEDNRAWLSLEQFNKLLERISKGELDLLEKTVNNFRMKKEYKDSLMATWKKSKGIKEVTNG